MHGQRNIKICPSDLHIAILHRFLEWRRRDMFPGFWLGYLEERDIVEDQCIGGQIILK
jgi:hypothetical protein